MARPTRSTTLLRCRVHEETLARVELRLYNQAQSRRKYGELGMLVDTLLQQWLNSSLEADNGRSLADASSVGRTSAEVAERGAFEGRVDGSDRADPQTPDDEHRPSAEEKSSKQ